MRLDSLLRDSQSDTLAVSPFKLTSQQVAQPSLKQRDDSSQEEDPYTPSGLPEPDTWSFPYWSSVESRVDQVLQILGHSDLLHELVPVRDQRLFFFLSHQMGRHDISQRAKTHLYRYIPVN